MKTHPISKAGTARAAPGDQQGTNRNELKQFKKPTPREQLVLFAIGYQKRYGLEIQRAISECSNGTESISIGSLYPTLHSLEKKGLVSSRFGDETAEERGGARRRYYSLTSDGISAIKAIQEYQSALLTWQSS